MSPSAAHHTMTTQDLQSNVANDPWNHQNIKENQRPPVFFPEDYITALKRFSSNSGSHKSIYDVVDETKNEKNVTNKSRTLPLSKNSDYK